MKNKVIFAFSLSTIILPISVISCKEELNVYQKFEREFTSVFGNDVVVSKYTESTLISNLENSDSQVISQGNVADKLGIDAQKVNSLQPTINDNHFVVRYTYAGILKDNDFLGLDIFGINVNIWGQDNIKKYSFYFKLRGISPQEDNVNNTAMRLEKRLIVPTIDTHISKNSSADSGTENNKIKGLDTLVEETKTTPITENNYISNIQTLFGLDALRLNSESINANVSASIVYLETVDHLKVYKVKFVIWQKYTPTTAKSFIYENEQDGTIVSKAIEFKVAEYSEAKYNDYVANFEKHRILNVQQNSFRAQFSSTTTTPLPSSFEGSSSINTKVIGLDWWKNQAYDSPNMNYIVRTNSSTTFRDVDGVISNLTFVINYKDSAPVEFSATISGFQTSKGLINSQITSTFNAFSNAVGGYSSIIRGTLSSTSNFAINHENNVERPYDDLKNQLGVTAASNEILAFIADGGVVTYLRNSKVNGPLGGEEWSLNIKFAKTKNGIVGDTQTISVRYRTGDYKPQ